MAGIGRGRRGGRLLVARPARGRRATIEQDKKLAILRQCQDAIAWLQSARGESVTSLWALREMFEDADEAIRHWKLVLDLMDHTFNVMLRGNQLVTDILQSLVELEGEDPFRALLAEKMERLEATGVRAVHGIRKFAEAVDPTFFSPRGRRAPAPSSPAGGYDPARFHPVREHLVELEAIIAEEERQLVDLEGFLSLRGRDLELGLRW
jgi:hypothetical protein